MLGHQCWNHEVFWVFQHGVHFFLTPRKCCCVWCAWCPWHTLVYIFSAGVIFALKVLTSSETPPGREWVHFMWVPTRYAAWAELILIHLLVPNASFMGHLAGILSGLIYTSTPIGTIVDEFISSLTGLYTLLIHMYWWVGKVETFAESLQLNTSIAVWARLSMMFVVMLHMVMSSHLTLNSWFHVPLSDNQCSKWPTIYHHNI